MSLGPLDLIGNTPMVELPGLRPQGGGRVLAKWEGGHPTGSMKDRMALAMIEGARREGLLAPGQRVVEYTGGSTGSSLAFVCAALGHPLSIITADCFAAEKIDTMRALGADVEVLGTPDGRVYPGLGPRMFERAQEVRDRTGAYWTNQIENPHQLEGYERMGTEVLAQAPDLTDFVMSVGGGGCSMGNARAFRAAGRDVAVTLLEPAEAPYISNDEPKGHHDVEGIAVFPRPKLALLDDDLYERVVGIPEADGRSMARRLAREHGMLVGTSSGLNLVGAIQVANERGADAVVVTVLVDSGLRYLRGGLYS